MDGGVDPNKTPFKYTYDLYSMKGYYSVKIPIYLETVLSTNAGAVTKT